LKFLARLRYERVAWSLGGLLLVSVTGLAFSYFGWFGVGLVGLVGLVITMQLALNRGHAMGGGYQGVDLRLYAKQLKEHDSHTRPTEKLAAKDAETKRTRVIKICNTAFIAMAAIGFGVIFLRFL